MNLPDQYAWLDKEPGPKMLKNMSSLYGTKEVPGVASNPAIMAWAKAIGVSSAYSGDDIPWCGLTVGYVAWLSGYPSKPDGNPLWARNWCDWGQPVKHGQEMLGDVLVFERGNSGHVALYVGEDDSAFHIIGGNQGDKVCIERKPKYLLLKARRSPWKVAQPPNVRKVYLSPEGAVELSEA